MIELNTSWLHGKYANGEINTSMPYVSVNNPEFSAQGEEAEAFINTIHGIWLKGDCTEEEAFNRWVNIMF